MAQMVKRSTWQCRRPGSDPWVGKSPWRRKWQPIPVFLSGKSHGWRSLAGCGSWGHKESNTTERLALHFIEKEVVCREGMTLAQGQLVNQQLTELAPDQDPSKSSHAITYTISHTLFHVGGLDVMRPQSQLFLLLPCSLKARVVFKSTFG